MKILTEKEAKKFGYNIVKGKDARASVNDLDRYYLTYNSIIAGPNGCGFPTIYEALLEITERVETRRNIKLEKGFQKILKPK